MRQEQVYAAIMRSSGIKAFEYFPEEDRLVVLDEWQQPTQMIENFLTYLENESGFHPEDRQKAVRFFGMDTEENEDRREMEVRLLRPEREIRKLMQAVFITDEETGARVMIGASLDITDEKDKEQLLEKQARTDALTELYNRVYGKELISQYLLHKDPYASCGLLIIDIDYFKNVNDNFGHLFGDEALVKLAGLLRLLFEEKDIIMRAGGDEFVVLLKNIRHGALVKKTMQLVKAVRELTFSRRDYCMTCSVGVCFLPENSGIYTYEQLFKNADWALYKSKERGRNRYTFCDNLSRFAFAKEEEKPVGREIEARYLRGDIISTAFEIFEKMNSFDMAVRLLMQVIGARFGLDRIVIINTDIKEKRNERRYQWISDRVPKIQEQEGSFSKEDFLTLFHSYDEYDTAVLQKDDLGRYSREAAEFLMQGDAKTAVYAAMYCEGRYTGAMAYAVCGSKRYWSATERSQLGELTKIVSAHLAKKQAMNAWHKSLISPDYDELTGLLGFSRFREEAEKIILGNSGVSYIMLYTDIARFQDFNEKFGYSMGDRLLREFAAYVMGVMEEEMEVYFARVVSDQFVMLRPHENLEGVEQIIDSINRGFARRQQERFPGARICVRTGIYYVEEGCVGASAAIDKANAARKQILPEDRLWAKLYREEQ